MSIVDLLNCLYHTVNVDGDLLFMFFCFRLCAFVAGRSTWAGGVSADDFDALAVSIDFFFSGR